MSKPKLTYDEVLDLLNEGRYVDPDQVNTRTLLRTVWSNCNGFPGCLPDSLGYNRSKADAITSCLTIADDGTGPPRGMKTALERNEVYRQNGYVYTVTKYQVSHLL